MAWPIMLLGPALYLAIQLSPSLAYAQDMPSQGELDKINDAIALIQTRIQQTTTERSGVLTELSQAEKAVAELNQKLKTINTNIDTETKQLADLAQQNSTLQQDKHTQQATIAQYIRSAYLGGQEEYLKLLLNQQNIEKSARSLRYYEYFNQARAEKIGRFNETIAELSALQIKIQQSNLNLKENREQLKLEQQALLAKRTARQSLLDELDVMLSQRGSELAQLEQERAEMELLIEELSQAIANLSLGAQDQAFAERKGQLPWPAEGLLLNSFGASHELGDLNWEGVTIAANEGDEITAIHHGRVIFSDWFANSGLLLIIDHGDGYMSLYAHNQLLYKTVGDWVNSGEIISAAGNTGGRKENGVYFEIRSNGKALDPVSWCVRR